MILDGAVLICLERRLVQLETAEHVIAIRITRIRQTRDGALQLRDFLGDGQSVGRRQRVIAPLQGQLIGAGQDIHRI